MAVECKSFLLRRHFVGLPKEDDFIAEIHQMPPLCDGEYLIESLFLSVDPYMRVYTGSMLKERDTMIGGGVGRVVQSKNADIPVGTLIVGPIGWRTHHIPSKQNGAMFRKVPEMEPLSYSLGVLGMPGLTAYYGFLDICNPQAGETVFVNTAAGAVGSIVGQIAKIKGCYVVGCAGSDKKVDYLKEIGYDGSFNYKTSNLDAKLKELFPKGIDCFFDNVGGEMFDVTLTHMKKYGRVSLCGCISMYNSGNERVHSGPMVHNLAIPKELKLQGFLASSFHGKANEGYKQLNAWIQEGKLKVKEHIVEGIDNMPKAFISLFEGENIGKVVVKVN